MIMLEDLREVVRLDRYANHDVATRRAIEFIRNYAEQIERNAKDIEFIRAHVDQIERDAMDAKRYRWLRVSACDVAWNEWYSYAPGYTPNGSEELDDAIDAAMSKEGG